MKFLVRFLGNFLALYAAHFFVFGFTVSNGLKGFLIAGLILGLLNLTVKPILKVIAFPVIFITLGLFNIVINAIIVWGVSELTGIINFNGYYPLFWATIIITAVNMAVNLLGKLSKY